jgi:Zn-dependent protease
MVDEGSSRTYVTYRFGPDPDSMRSRRRSVGIRFHKEELNELGVAMLIITLAFAVVFSNNHVFSPSHDLMRFLLVLPYSFIATFTGFGLHELAHKISANHFGYPAAFSYNKKTLIYGALISVVIGFLFAAPGAVYIFGRPTVKENGIISAAGPFTNLIIGFISLGAFIPLILINEFVGMGALMVGIINLIIGSFNMIPVMPLDGSKIWKWNKAIYLIMLVFLLGPVIAFFMFQSMIL